MEPDISILRKTGHFYFALTAAATSPFPLSPTESAIPSISLCFSWASIPACRDVRSPTFSSHPFPPGASLWDLSVTPVLVSSPRTSPRESF